MLRASLTMLGLAASMATAQPAAQPCRGMNQGLTGPLAGWLTPAPVAGHAVALGRAVRVPLSRSAAAGPFEATLSFRIARGGSYEIALSAAAWIDVVHNGATLTSTAHRHGPPCSTIRKIVSFTLAPGAYQLRLTRSPAAAATLAIFPA